MPVVALALCATTVLLQGLVWVVWVVLLLMLLLLVLVVVVRLHVSLLHISHTVWYVRSVPDPCCRVEASSDGGDGLTRPARRKTLRVMRVGSAPPSRLSVARPILSAMVTVFPTRRAATRLLLGHTHTHAHAPRAVGSHSWAWSLGCR